ncbi:MAG: hypothetical protein ACXVQJ_11560 [Actinomycetota bacterium]
MIQWATTPEERVVVGTLADLPLLAAAAAVGPPATLVVGEVVRLANRAVSFRAGGHVPLA